MFHSKDTAVYDDYLLMLYYPDRSLNATSTVPTSEVRAAGMLVL
jgi:hypothetical protein